LLRDLEFAKSEQANALERSYLARQSAELTAAYGETLSGFEANAQWFQNASGNSRALLWSRLAQMSRETAWATQKLIKVAQGGVRQMRVHEPTMSRAIKSVSGPKPEPLFEARVSASASCGHACRIRLVSLVPIPANLVRLTYTDPVAGVAQW
jgi:hypothetical protein